MKLKNQEIWMAYPNLLKLSQFKFPVKTGLQIGYLVSKLDAPYKVIEQERRKLVNLYGKVVKGTDQTNVDLKSPEAGDFSREFGELLMQEWPDEFEFERIKLPEKVDVKCEGCERVLEFPFLVDPQTLMPLQETFLEATG